MACQSHSQKQGTWGGNETMTIGNEIVIYRDKACSECGKPCDREIVSRIKSN